MLSESSLWIMACGPGEDLASVSPECIPQISAWQATRRASAASATHVVASSTLCSSAATRGDSPELTVRGKDRSSQPGPAVIQTRGPFDRGSGSKAPVRASGLEQGNISPEVGVPRQGVSVSEGLFLVPASCKPICQNYSDLCIRGDQVLPLSSENTEDHLLGASTKAVVPFLRSCDMDPEREDSLAERSFQAGQFLLRRRAGSHQWRQGSGRDLSILFHGRDGPITYSLRNCFLEHKLMNLSRDQAGAPCPLLASEFIQTSLDQLTQQLIRELRLEASLPNDTVVGRVLRVASDMQSGEISTPSLQFSEDRPTPQAEALSEEELGEPVQPGQDSAERGGPQD